MSYLNGLISLGCVLFVWICVLNFKIIKKYSLNSTEGKISLAMFLIAFFLGFYVFLQII